MRLALSFFSSLSTFFLVLFVAFVELITFNRVRGQHFYRPARPSLRWWYTGTKRFGHGGWICLNFNWLRRFHGWAA